jgi:hypothetical protein
VREVVARSLPKCSNKKQFLVKFSTLLWKTLWKAREIFL